ncbi:hypothetical protein BJV78DRAFT_954259 [Lactifluus subvellereus]|nr:hypothetical protein BJV78DRAFT_954259 [Lactifluus subvellereus]
MSVNRGLDLEAQSGTSPAPGGGSEDQDMGIHRSARDAREDAPSQALIPARGQVELETQAQGQANTDPAPNDLSLGGVPNGGGSDQEPQVRMVGDFDNNANALWTLYGKEAKSHDEARIQSLKDDMDGVLIFAGLFSASLTSFIINSVQNLQPSPAQQTAYYMQQNVAMLAQISQQISSIAPQVAIPPNPPPPFSTFKPLSSDVRVNVFWFMALVFGLSAALLAILVQQWVRDYMHVFQRYSDPLKSARLRQYLYDGSEGWYMPVLAEAVPGLLHASLFLFFLGLVDFVLNINTAVAVYTTIPIGITVLFYVFTTFAPVICPQSPYQNSFSGLIWYIVQRLHGRRYKDRGSSGSSKVVSPNMAKGQMQLAMEETERRKGRDERAVQWLFNNLTEDAEMESFAMAIPGSFNTEWGLGVWNGVFGAMGHENDSNGNQLATGPLTDMNANNPMPPAITTPQHSP